MTTFTIHTQETAPAESKPLLAAVQGKYGMIPNLLAEMADAPNVLQGYLQLSDATAKGTLSPTEQQIVEITTSRVQGCEYCVAAHSTVAGIQKLPNDVVDAVRTGSNIADAKLQALHAFTVAVNEKNGWTSDADLSVFLAAGYTQAQVLEVVLNVTLKLFSGYANHIMHTPIDAAFQPKHISLNSTKKAA